MHPREYYNLPEAANKINCSIEDLLDWGMHGRIQLFVNLPQTMAYKIGKRGNRSFEEEEHVLYGPHPVFQEQILDIVHESRLDAIFSEPDGDSQFFFDVPLSVKREDLHVKARDIAPEKGTLQRSYSQATKRENTLLKIIGGLIQIHYLNGSNKEAYLHGGKPNANAIAQAFVNKLQDLNFNSKGIETDTIRRKNTIPEAIERINQNKN